MTPGRANASSFQRRPSRRWLFALVASLLPAVLTFTGPGPATAETGTVPFAPDATAYFTHPLTKAIPPVLTTEFPPGVVCIVAGIGGAPEVCGDTVQELKAILAPTPLNVDAGLPLPDSFDPILPQPVLPGTLPVGLIGGQERYASFLRFPTPTVAEGNQIDRLQLVLHEAGLTAAFDSPAFRAATVAALSQVSAPNPDLFVELVERLAAGEIDLLGMEPTGIEACLVAEDWDPGASQPGAYQPDVDCVFGTNGVRDAAARTWTFDLTNIARAWVEGTPNHGISLKPRAAENVAYGDPDISTNFLVSLGVGTTGTTPGVLTLVTSATPPDLPPLGGDDFGNSGGGLDLPPLGNLPDGGSDQFAAPAIPAPPVSSGRSNAGGDSGGRPSISPDLQPISTGSTWWLWLLLPIGVLALWGYSGAVDAEQRNHVAGSGALTRLMQRRTG